MCQATLYVQRLDILRVFFPLVCATSVITGVQEKESILNPRYQAEFVNSSPWLKQFRPSCIQFEHFCLP